jgi:hypothetical protein
MPGLCVPKFDDPRFRASSSDRDAVALSGTGDGASCVQDPRPARTPVSRQRDTIEFVIGGVGAEIKVQS